MSHILFGDFMISYENYQKIDKVKQCLSQKGIRLYIDNEINFYSDIQLVLSEQSENKHRQIFCLTTDNQPTNSEDLLFPYDKYSNEELFPNGEERNIFNEFCKNNLEEFKQGIKCILEFVEIKKIRIFVTEGYDNQFEILHCSIDEMINHMLKQVISAYYIDSAIYYIS